MPIFSARVIRTITDEYAATIEVEADSLDEAIQHFEDLDPAELKEDGIDYHDADEAETHFRACEIDGVAVGDEWADVLKPLPMVPLDEALERARTQTMGVHAELVAQIGDNPAARELLDIFWNFVVRERELASRVSPHD
jgi:hypothetical protein